MSQPAITVGSYNVLNPYHAVKWATEQGLTEDGKQRDPQFLRDLARGEDEEAWKLYSNWSERKELLAENIYHAAIVCLQEVSEETIIDLQIAAPFYLVSKVGFHEASRRVEQFGNAIMYDHHKARLLNSFEIEHIVQGEKDAWSRNAVCAVFEVSGKVIKVASVHLSGYNPTETELPKKQASKEVGYKELQAYVTEIEKDLDGIDGIVIAGDFNEDPSEAVREMYRPGYLESQGYRNDGNLTVTEPSKGRKIDWVYYKDVRTKDAQLSSAELEHRQRQVSDHLMTGTEIRW